MGMKLGQLVELPGLLVQPTNELHVQWETVLESNRGRHPRDMYKQTQHRNI